MPRSTSTGAANPHIFVPERSFHPSPQVSLYFDPGLGTVWNSQSFLPVLASNARGFPAGPCGTSLTLAPMMTTLRYSVGVPL